jgi:hypothetical protein
MIKIKHLALLITITATVLVIANFYINTKYQNYVEVNNTTTGMYALIGDKMYTLNELQLEKEPNYGMER